MRALAHHLKPVVQIGTQGVSEGVVKATQDALTTHELIKVRVVAENDEELGALGARLASATRSHLAQVIGRMLLLYKRRKTKPTILFPGEKPPRERAATNLKRTASPALKKRRAKVTRAKRLTRQRKKEG